MTTIATKRDQNGLLERARVLVVDDEASNTRILERILTRAGCQHVVTVNDPRRVLGLRKEFAPDLVLLDLHMPELDGFAVLDLLRSNADDGDPVPVLVLTGDGALEAKERAFASGAKDFLTKPFETSEVLLRVRNLLETRFLQRRLLRDKETLEVRVEERTREREGAYLETLTRLARAAEFRDDDTGEHTRRVGTLAARLAEALELEPDFVDRIARAAPLHDVGKIGISDGILLKPGPLTPDEWERMKTHTTIGARILSGSASPYVRLAEEIAQTHHERWDGTGYDGLEGEDIPLSGRIVAIVDVFDALSHDRPYRKAWPRSKVIAEIESQAGRHFDPQITDVFLRLQKDIPDGLAERAIA